MTLDGPRGEYPTSPSVLAGTASAGPGCYLVIWAMPSGWPLTRFAVLILLVIERPGIEAGLETAQVTELAQGRRVPAPIGAGVSGQSFRAATARLLPPRSAFSVAVASCRAGGRVAISLVRRNLVDFCLGNVRLGLGDVRTRGLHDCPGCGRGLRRRRLSERRRGQSLPGHSAVAAEAAAVAAAASTAASAATAAASAATRPRRATARVRSAPRHFSSASAVVGRRLSSVAIPRPHPRLAPRETGNEIVRKHAPHAIVPQGTRVGRDSPWERRASW